MKRVFTTLAVIGLIVISCKKDKDKTPPTAPVVTTAALTNINISAGTATAGGSIVSDGGAAITQSGIVWSKTNNTPTLTDSVEAGTTTSGTFTNDLSGLDFGNTYYFRAFATNSVGTGYGNVISLTTSNDSVRFAYNGQSVTYGIITSPTTGKKWLDRNLGATRQATAFDDYQAYGDLFQWGRPADGHELINWTASNAGTAVNGTTSVEATSDIPGHSNFIYYPATSTHGDWRNDNNRNRWNTNPQGPCPSGWHVPTMADWWAETSNTIIWGTANAGGIKDRYTAFDLLKLTVTGYRNGEDATFKNPGSNASYWSSEDEYSPDGYYGGRKYQVGPDYVQSSFVVKADGGAVRCLKD